MILLAMNYPFEILTRIEAKFPKSCSVLLNLRSYKTRFCLFAVFIYIYIYISCSGYHFTLCSGRVLMMNKGDGEDKDKRVFLFICWMLPTGFSVCFPLTLFSCLFWLILFVSLFVFCLFPFFMLFLFVFRLPSVCLFFVYLLCFRVIFGLISI